MCGILQDHKVITNKQKPEKTISIIEVVDYIECKSMRMGLMTYRYRIIVIQEISILI